MNLLNRIALVVTAKKPYFAWAKALDKDDLLGETTPVLPTVYLVAAFGGQQSDQELLEMFVSNFNFA